MSNPNDTAWRATLPKSGAFCAAGGAVVSVWLVQTEHGVAVVVASGFTQRAQCVMLLHGQVVRQSIRLKDSEEATVARAARAFASAAVRDVRGVEAPAPRQAPRVVARLAEGKR